MGFPLIATPMVALLVDIKTIYAIRYAILPGRSSGRRSSP